MIAQVDSSSERAFSQLLMENPVTGCKMWVRHHLFGNRKNFCTNYLLQSGEHLAALQIFEQTAYWCGADDAYSLVIEEVVAFARFCGAITLEFSLIDTPTQHLNALTDTYPCTQNTIYQCRALSEEECTTSPDFEVTHNPQSLKATYALLCTCFPEFGEVVCYDNYLAETMPKVNAQKAIVFTATQSCTAIATASLSFIAEHTILLGAVAVHPDLQGQKFGRKILQNATNVAFELQKPLYTVAADSNAEHFYNHINFKSIGCQLTVALWPKAD